MKEEASLATSSFHFGCYLISHIQVINVAFRCNLSHSFTVTDGFYLVCWQAWVPAGGTFSFTIYPINLTWSKSYVSSNTQFFIRLEAGSKSFCQTSSIQEFPQAQNAPQSHGEEAQRPTHKSTQSSAEIPGSILKRFLNKLVMVDAEEDWHRSRSQHRMIHCQRKQTSHDYLLLAQCVCMYWRSITINAAPLRLIFIYTVAIFSSWATWKACILQCVW